MFNTFSKTNDQIHSISIIQYNITIRDPTDLYTGRPELTMGVWGPAPGHEDTVAALMCRDLLGAVGHPVPGGGAGDRGVETLQTSVDVPDVDPQVILGGGLQLGEGELLVRPLGPVAGHITPVIMSVKGVGVFVLEVRALLLQPPLNGEAVVTHETHLEVSDGHLVCPEVTHLLVGAIQTVEVTVTLVGPVQTRHAVVTSEPIRAQVLELHGAVLVEALGLICPIVAVVSAVTHLAGVDALAAQLTLPLAPIVTPHHGLTPGIVLVLAVPTVLLLVAHPRVPDAVSTVTLEFAPGTKENQKEE